MAEMDIVVIPSLFESFGYVGLEAMTLRKPVIASAVGGLQEIFNSEIALLVKPGDEAALAEAIIQCMHFPELTERRVSKGFERCSEHFSLDNMIETLSKQYQGAVSI